MTDETPTPLDDRLQRLAREQERLFAELVAGERRFRGLAKAVWRVQEDERRRLARELHDGLGQTLTALKIRLERLRQRVGDSQPELARELTEPVELAAAALGEARRLSRFLRPQVLDDLGLTPALSWLARSFEEWTGFTVRLHVPGDPAEENGSRRLDPDLETLVFRFVQEGLNNAVKHSGGDQAEVSVELEDGKLHVRVADFGDGFDPSEVRGSDGAGSGLSGLRERVRVFGGRFHLDAAPGRGTVLQAVLPLEVPRAREDSR